MNDRMVEKLALGGNRGRFDWIYDATSDARQPWDVTLDELLGTKSVPSLGSIVPGWALTFPQTKNLNLSHSTSDERQDVIKAALAVAKAVGGFAAKVYHFEHGAAQTGSLMGCGVDSAHLHTVPLDFDLLTAAEVAGAGSVDWTYRQLVPELWDELGGTDYYVAWESGQEKVLVGKSRKPTSQFFRKVIAANLGLSHAWNYREHKFEENVRLTQKAFSGHDRSR